MGSAAGDAVKVKELEDEVKSLAEKANNACISHATMLRNASQTTKTRYASFQAQQRQQQRRNGGGESNGDIAQVPYAFAQGIPSQQRYSTDLVISRERVGKVKERTQRIAAEKKVKTLEAEVEELSATLFQEADEMVSSARQQTAALQRKLELMEQRAAEQRPAGDLDTLHKENARLRERFKILEQRDSDLRRRLEKLEAASKRVERDPVSRWSWAALARHIDKEYYVMQSEWYHEPPEKDDDGRRSSEVEFSYPHGLREEPNVVVLNGSESALTRDKPLKASMNDTVRIFFGNAGPNLTSAFHVIGSNFKRAYRDGDVVSPPGQFVSTLSVPPGGTTIVDMHMLVPGTMTLVDHAIFRIDKGAVGYLNVSGKSRLDVYQSVQPPAPCVGCKLHP
ncbi:hypothetical protein LTR01_008920 [Friedmanniomyces endolithicus]|nr:hypothetical protein LTR01_008920 [Friedmanniomyces endolithicus]